MKNKIVRGIALIAVSFLLVVSLPTTKAKAETLQMEWLPYHYDATFANGGTAWGQTGQFYMDGVFSYCTDIRTQASNGSYYNIATDGGKFKDDPVKTDRLKLLAYYGYGGGGAVGDSDGYKLATQELIWRTVHTDMTYFSWRNGVDVSFEKSVTENAIANHYIISSFAWNSYDINLGESITITDTNNVISNASLVEVPPGIEVSTVGNQVTIKANSTLGSGQIIKWKKNFPNYTSAEITPIFFEAPNGSQSQIRVGGADPIPFSTGIRVLSGGMEVNKVDSVTSSKLKGAEFKLEQIDDNGEKHVMAESVTTNINGKIVLNILPLGNYQLTEIKAPEGYLLNPTPINFSITQNWEQAQVNISNDGYGAVEITKNDRNVENTMLEGAEFELERYNDESSVWEKVVNVNIRM